MPTWPSSSTGRALCRCTTSSRRRSRAAIRDGELAPGDRFENELALAKRLTLSRPTTRRAIQELVDKGLLVRKRGRRHPGGAERRASAGSSSPACSTTSRGPARSRRPSCSTTTSASPTKTSPPSSTCATDTEVVTIQRLRCANGEPLAVMTNYLPVDLAPGRRRARGATGSTSRCGPAACTSGWPGSASARSRPTRTEARLLDEKAGRAAADDEPHRLRRLGQGRRVRQPLLPGLAVLLRDHPRRPLTPTRPLATASLERAATARLARNLAAASCWAHVSRSAGTLTPQHLTCSPNVRTKY